MFVKGSRYEAARRFEGADFEGVRPRDMGPSTGVVEHVIQVGDRLDLLARHYYNDSRLFWRILDANPDILFGGDVELSEVEGEILLIPKAKE